jgi:hypothetical protein
MGNKITIDGVTETKARAEPKGMSIQRLLHMGIHTVTNPYSIVDSMKYLLTRA